VAAIIGGLLESIVNSPTLQILSVGYLLAKGIVVYDSRILQARWRRMNSGVAARAGGRVCPTWVGAFVFVEWALILTILVFNWKYAIALYVFSFLLKVLPVLEVIGEIIMRPFLRAPRSRDP